MTFLEKLDMLIDRNKLNKRKLSELSGIPYTTIANWYQRGYENMSITTFKSICTFFGVTMDYMARDELTEIEYYSPDRTKLRISDTESHVLNRYRAADPLDKELVHRALGISVEKENIETKIS